MREPGKMEVGSCVKATGFDGVEVPQLSHDRGDSVYRFLVLAGVF
jgi:hypothetical protein